MYNNFLVRKREKDILSLKQIVFFFYDFFSYQIYLAVVGFTAYARSVLGNLFRKHMQNNITLTIYSLLLRAFNAYKPKCNLHYRKRMRLAHWLQYSSQVVKGLKWVSFDFGYIPIMAKKKKKISSSLSIKIFQD